MNRIYLNKSKGITAAELTKLRDSKQQNIAQTQRNRTGVNCKGAPVRLTRI